MQNLQDTQNEWEARAQRAQGAAAQAMERLLTLAETRDSGQIRTVVNFLASTYNSQDFPYDPFELRMVDVPISDDMLACLDALRWGRADLYKLVRDGAPRIEAVIQAWGLTWRSEGAGR